MSNMLLAVIVLTILFVAFRSFRLNETGAQPGRLQPDPGLHLEDLVRRLMHSTSDDAFLIVRIENSEDFLQMTGGPTGVQLDFPMITDRQKSLESRIRETAANQGLTVQENRGTGDLFLDIDISGEPAHIAAVCRRFMFEVFGATGGTFRYEHDGL